MELVSFQDLKTACSNLTENLVVYSDLIARHLILLTYTRYQHHFLTLFGTQLSKTIRLISTRLLNTNFIEIHHGLRIF